MIIFDSNIWIAFLHQGDSQHAKAEKIFDVCEGPMLVPEYVIAEVVTVLTRKNEQPLANQFLEMVIDNKDIDILFCSDQFFIQLTDFFKNHHRRNLSFVDMMLLQLASLYQVVTFDHALQKSIQSN